MQPLRGSRTLLTGLTLAAAVVVFALSSGRPAPAEPVPDRISDADFWRMVSEMSEPGGYFHSDNFVSNEAAFQYVIPDLSQRVDTGGVYVGVGPDQNFTYLVAFRPRIAFIVDIRRQNMIQHLMYKALIEMSVDRSAFLSRLFSRPEPEAFDTTATIDLLVRAFAMLPPDTTAFQRNLAALTDYLVRTKGFGLSQEDRESLAYVYGAFYAGGPELTYSFGPGRYAIGGMGMPTYGYLLTETDGRGRQRSYLADEANYRVLRDLESRNLIVPVVGNFAGDHALRAVGRWVRDHGARVSLFYTSNVEQYLFQQGDEWQRFYANIATLPRSDTSTFIRSVSNRQWARTQNPNSRSAQLMSSVNETVDAFHAGSIRSYYDVIRMSR
jgi:hypothetical protein